MGNQRDRQFTLPKNIRQMGQFGDTYKIYVEDFVYTYVHRTLHMEKQEHEIAAAVLLGKTCRRNNQEYIFISGAQQVSFSEWGQADETDSMQHFTENDMTVFEIRCRTKFKTKCGTRYGIRYAKRRCCVSNGRDYV